MLELHREGIIKVERLQRSSVADDYPRGYAEIRDDKYLHTPQWRIRAMPQLIEPTEPDAQQEIIRLALDELAGEIGVALREEHLDFPVFLTVPNSGESLATMACPLDPTDTQWAHASTIVCRIIGQRLGDVRLRGRALHCAVANAPMGAAEVTADTGSEE
jgi:hypothetical protein